MVFCTSGSGTAATLVPPIPSIADRTCLRCLGKCCALEWILRLDRSLQHAIPTDNPFVAGGGLPEIFAQGLRNPWRFSLERGGSRIFVADVGESSWEEVDILLNGGNYGWSVMEGAHCFNPPT